MSSNQPDNAASQELLGGRYLPVREIGSGGSGVVYEAVHHLTRERVAVKVIELKQLGDNQRTVARFMREAKLSHQIQTDGVVKVMDAWIDDQRRCCLVMELLRGMSLREVIDQGKLERARVLKWVIDAFAPLEAAHRAGVIHRDLKPENIYVHIPPLPEGDTLITSQPMFFDEALGELRPLSERDINLESDYDLESDLEVNSDLAINNEPELTLDVTDVEIIESWHRAQVKLLDFGLSRSFISPSVTQTGHFVGTPWYMSPEQIFSPKSCTHIADLWSMGVILYEVLTGQLPFSGGSIPELCLAVRDQSPPSILELKPETPPLLAECIEKCLQKDTSLRIQSAAQLKYQLDLALSQFADCPYAKEPVGALGHKGKGSQDSQLESTLSAGSDIRGQISTPPLTSELTEPEIPSLQIKPSEIEPDLDLSMTVTTWATSDDQGLSDPSSDEVDQRETLQLDPHRVREHLHQETERAQAGSSISRQTAELISREIFEVSREEDLSYSAIQREESEVASIQLASTSDELSSKSSGAEIKAPLSSLKLEADAIQTDRLIESRNEISGEASPPLRESLRDSLNQNSNKAEVDGGLDLTEAPTLKPYDKFLLPLDQTPLINDEAQPRREAPPPQSSSRSTVVFTIISLFILGVGLGVLIRFLGLV